MSFVWPSASSLPLRCEENVGLGNMLTQPFHGRRRDLLQASDVMTQDMWEDKCTISSGPRGSVDVPCHHLDNSALTTWRRSNAWNLLVLRFSLFVYPVGGWGGGKAEALLPPCYINSGRDYRRSRFHPHPSASLESLRRSGRIIAIHRLYFNGWTVMPIMLVSFADESCMEPPTHFSCPLRVVDL